ncbi:MAG: GNAT family N-acetyltransferase [Caldilineaceae bacterium]|nr:GNAT family N-acetyltransferase [Caldilineaceae bacterium]
MRSATEYDIPALADFYDNIFREEHDPPAGFRTWIVDLTSGQHPVCRVDNFVVVEDQRRDGRIVSSGVLLPQRCMFAGVAVTAGQPELIATDPDYRHRGLVREVIEGLHGISQRLDHLFQFIGGIPWFYRQFGYEYAVAMNMTRTLSATDMPRLPAGQTEPFSIRLAEAGDLSDLQRLHRQASQRWLLSTVCDEARWRYELLERSRASLETFNIWTLVRGDERTGKVVGYGLAKSRLRGSKLGIWELVADEDISWHSLLPSVLRGFQCEGQTLAAATEGATFDRLEISLDGDHPAWEFLQPLLSPRRPPYAWYVRVADLPRLVRQIAPALEKRLARSPMAGYSGSLEISFFREAVCMAWQDGKLEQFESLPMEALEGHRPAAMFPPLVFLQLLFGARTLDQLQESFADCRATNEARLLLTHLFPPQPSSIRPLV